MFYTKFEIRKGFLIHPESVPCVSFSKTSNATNCFAMKSDKYKLVNVLTHEPAKALGFEDLYADSERVAILLSKKICEKRS